MRMNTFIGQRKPARKIDWRLCLIADSEVLASQDVLATVEQAIAGGVTMVQLRGKSWKDRQFFETALELQKFLDQKGIPLIINDRVDIALATHATGLHLGQQDLPLSVARQILGPGFIIGISVNNPEEAHEAEKQGADYLGAGPVFWTSSKPDLRQPIGLDGLRAICSSSSLPVLAVGGVTEENAAAIMAAGASGVAVIKAICAAPDPRLAALNLRKSIDLL